MKMIPDFGDSALNLDRHLPIERNFRPLAGTSNTPFAVVFICNTICGQIVSTRAACRFSGAFWSEGLKKKPIRPAPTKSCRDGRFLAALVRGEQGGRGLLKPAYGRLHAPIIPVSGSDTCRSARSGLVAYFFLSDRWLSAEPAALLESFPVLPLLRTLEAAVPAFFPVCSFLVMA